MASDRLIIGPELTGMPVNRSSRRTIVSQLYRSVRETISDTTAQLDTIKIYDGDVYPHISPVTCPNCMDRVKINELTLDDTDKATGYAGCSCGWSGRAVYKLIDLVDPGEQAIGNQHTFESVVAEGPSGAISHPPLSAVARGDLRPLHVPYTGTTSYGPDDF